MWTLFLVSQVYFFLACQLVYLNPISSILLIFLRYFLDVNMELFFGCLAL